MEIENKYLLAYSVLDLQGEISTREAKLGSINAELTAKRVELGNLE